MCLVLWFCFFSCNDEKSTNPLTDFNISGRWYTTETATSDCGGANPEVEYNIYVITQNGTNLTASIEGESFSWNGSVEGNKVSWNISRPTDNGITDINFSGTVSTDGTSMTGTATWTWNSNGSSSSCSGITTISSNKVLPAETSLAGKWEGAWNSSGGSYNGTFSTTLTQDGSTLSGSISVPEIGMSGANVKGIVSGKNVAFGDIDNRIQFSGTIGSDTSKMSGEFYYAGYDVSGTWNGQEAGPPDSMVIIIDSLNISTSMLSDIAFGDGKFFVLNNEEIDLFNSAGVKIKSIATPGNYARGLAFGNNQIICTDGAWGLAKVFEMDPDGKSILKSPSDDECSGLAFDGTYFWALNADYSGAFIYQLTESGEKLDSIACQGELQKGLAAHGDYLWYSTRTGGGISAEYRINKINHNGDQLGHYTMDDWYAPGLTHDGITLWYGDDGAGYFYALNDEWSKTDSIPWPENGIGAGDLAWDGSHFWVVDASAGGFEESMIYRVSTSGIVVDSLSFPGEWPGDGLAARSGYIWAADNTTNRIYRIPFAGENFFPLPEGDFRHLTFDGTNYWLATDEATLVKFDRNGNILNIYDDLIENSWGGIAYDGSGIWFVEKTFNMMVKLSKVDLSGNVVISYEAAPGMPEPGALCFDGISLWMTGSNDYTNFYLYKIGVDLP